MGSPINFSGLSSGIDTATIVEKLMQLERRPLQLIQQEQLQIRQKKALLSDFSSRLGKLDSAIGKLASQSTLSSKSVSSSSADVSATATAFAAPGSFTITEITSLASKHSESFVGISDQDATFASGTTFSFDVGSESFSVDVSALSADDNNLVGLRDAINDQADGYASASIINTGDADDPYKLIIQSVDSGVENRVTNISTDVTVTTSGGDVALATVGAEQILGLDATFEFNGVQISRSSNVVDDLIEGISLTLNDTSTTPISLTVSADTEALKTRLNEFIAAYNNVNSVFQEQFSVNAEGRAGAMAGDSALRQIQGNIQSVLVSGVTDADGNRYSLGTVGIEVDGKTGALSLDTERFEEAMNNSDKELVLDLFMSRGTATNRNVSYVTSSDETNEGVYDITVTGDDGSGNVTGYFSYGGTDYTGVGQGQFLVGPEDSPMEDLRVKIAAGATGSLGSMNYSVGVAERFDRLINDFLTPVTGLLPSLNSRMESDIKAINEQILDFEDRLVERERVLRNQFLAAEDAIAQLNAQQQQFAAQASKM